MPGIQWCCIIVAVVAFVAPPVFQAQQCEGPLCGRYSDEESENKYAPQLQTDEYEIPDTDPEVDYNKKGIDLAKAGDLVGANKNFVRASLRSPYRGDIWANVALSLRDLVEQGRSPGGDKDDLRQAIAGFDLGSLLGNSPSAKMRTDSMEYFRQLFPGECPASDCKRWKTEMKAMKLVKAMKHVEAVNLLCKPVEQLTIHLSPSEHRRGIIDPQSMRSLLYTLRICGVVSIANVYSPDVLHSVHEAQKPLFSDFYTQRSSKTAVRKSNHQGNPEEYVNAADRGPLRYEVKFPVKEPFTDTKFFANRFVLMLAKATLDDHIEIDTFSSVTSLPGAGMQNWHADVGHLFERTIVDESQHIPTQGVVVVAPLVDLDSETGPTEFMTGSHVGMGINFWHDHDTSPITPVHKIPAKVGSVVMFDLRTRHRGTPNRSNERRPICYLSYVRDWYSDKVNFKDKQSRRFDALGSMMAKKLFMRLDNLEYTAMLENIISEKTDIDLSELQSVGGYKKIDLHA